MTKTIDLTVSLKLQVDAATLASEFYDTLESTLRYDLDKLLVHGVDSIRVVSAYDPDLTLHREMHLEHMLEPMGKIADIWSVEDVLEVRPDLSANQAMDVLKLCVKTHDANFGITWDTLSFAAEQCFGEAPEPEEFND